MTRKQPNRVWDLHCHLAGVAGQSPEERMADLVSRADRMGIERVVVFMGYPFLADPTPDDLRRQNDQVLKGLENWGHKAFGFAYVNPNHVEASLREIDRCVRDGPMVGIKLWIARRCSDPQVDPIVARAAELKAVIFQHTWSKAGGNLPGESTPEDLVAMAARHPTIPIVCGHTGGDWERGVRAVRASSNVLVDIGGGEPSSGFVEMAVRELGARRVLYGSDAGGRSFATQLAKVYSAAVPDEDKARILGGNLRELLGPILRAKGVAFVP